MGSEEALERDRRKRRRTRVRATSGPAVARVRDAGAVSSERVRLPAAEAPAQGLAERLTRVVG